MIDSFTLDMKSVRTVCCGVLLLHFGLNGWAASGNQSEPNNKDKLPNIIVILADDMGYADIGIFGASISTPHLDRMAMEGKKLTSFYVMPNCSPSRAALLTGSYPLRAGVPVVLGPQGPEWTKNRYTIGLNPKEETIADLLKQSAYATGIVGKWHLGHHQEHLPLNQGFDEFYGLPYSNDQWPLTDEVYPPLTLIEGNQPVDTMKTLADQARLTGLYTNKAIDFIKRHQEKPFFLYLAHSMPHAPVNASKEFKTSSNQGLYADVIREIDWSVGRILNVLDSLGLDDNTLVIFTSDNGPWLTYGNHAGSAGDFREGKQTTFEGGVRVPFIARWPGKIPANTESGAITGIIDILPTILQVTKAIVPSLAIDGESLWPLLIGEVDVVRQIHYFYADYQLQAVRKGPWKLHLPHAYESLVTPGVDGSRGVTTRKNQELALFNLDNDPGEQNNMIQDHPYVAEELQKLAKEYEAELNLNKREVHRAF